MAVRISEQTVRDLAGAEVAAEAERLLDQGLLANLTEIGGGAAGSVDQPDGQTHNAWVGVVDGEFVAECQCQIGADTGPAPEESDEVCVHAIAVTLAAVRAGWTWSSAATVPPAAELRPEVRRFAQIAGTLSHRELALMVGQAAAVDERMESLLMTIAGDDA